MLEDILAELIHWLQRNAVFLVEPGQHGFEAWAIVRRLADPHWKLGLVNLPTTRICLDFCLVSGNHETQGGQVEYLPLCHPHDRSLFQRSLAARAVLQAMYFYMIRLRYRFQRMAAWIAIT